MTKHVFGNKPSPAVVNYGLKTIAEMNESEFGADVKEFISKDFYVDDGLISKATEQEAIHLVKRTQKTFKDNGNLYLHKVASHSRKLLQAFPQEQLAKNLTEIYFDLQNKDIPLQRCVGMCWNIQSDAFTIRFSDKAKPFTRRGVLSTINSIYYDPLGFVAPVVIV